MRPYIENMRKLINITVLAFAAAVFSTSSMACDLHGAYGMWGFIPADSQKAPYNPAAQSEQKNARPSFASSAQRAAEAAQARIDARESKEKELELAKQANDSEATATE